MRFSVISLRKSKNLQFKNFRSNNNLKGLFLDYRGVLAFGVAIRVGTHPSDKGQYFITIKVGILKNVNYYPKS